MANDMKSGIGYLIPASGVIGFIIALLFGEFLASILITVLGILIWFLYMLVMESTIPKQMGNIIKNKVSTYVSSIKYSTRKG